jgi:hypothetical protein
MKSGTKNWRRRFCRDEKNGKPVGLVRVALVFAFTLNVTYSLVLSH